MSPTVVKTKWRMCMAKPPVADLYDSIHHGVSVPDFKRVALTGFVGVPRGRRVYSVHTQ